MEPAPKPSTDIAANTVFDRIALVLLLIAGAAALLTFRDYGLGWDDYAHSEYGELLLAFYRSGFRDQRALSFVNLYMYGGGFDLAAAAAAKILPFGLFETRRLVGAVVGLIGLAITWRTARRIAGPQAGLLALILLLACPLYVGHAFMNAKDAPFAVAMALLLFALVRAFQDYPKLSPPTVLVVGLGFGLSIGSRVMGGFGVVEALAGLVLLVAAEARREGLRPASTRLATFVLSVLPALILAYAVMALVWPWSVANPLNPLYAVEYFSHFFEEPWRELFDGKLITVTAMPRSYVPTLIALQMPMLFLLLGFGGAAAALIATARASLPPARRAILLAVALAALLPLAVTVLARPAMYNGIRHFVFVLPPLAVLGGIASAWTGERLWARMHAAAVAAAVVFAGGISLPMIEMVRLHPYEYTFYNRLVGGVAGAQSRYMLDFWGLSFKQASQALLAAIAQRGITRPIDRRWMVAVCGPHRSPQVELGPDFETTWDPKGADFAMMLGVFYCASFDAPILAEIRREGVLYARIYDIRGRSYPSLLTTPGLKGESSPSN